MQLGQTERSVDLVSEGADCVIRAADPILITLSGAVHFVIVATGLTDHYR
ncbi:MAG: hypothetical protein ABJO67_11675 [Pseudoruegeria sp.]